MIRTFKCPSCGGDLVYDPGSTQMKCIRCSRTTPFGEVDYEKDLLEAKPSEASDNDGNGKEEYHCANCGAVLDTDDYTASTVCRYCGSPMLLESRFSGDVKPSRILPFGFDKKKAQDNFKNWTGTGFLTPASFKTQATMDKVTGVYVPYWLYNYTADVNIKAIGTRTRIERTQTEEIIHTDHFDINRLTQTEYTNVPENAHPDLPSDKLSVLEPYDFENLTAFVEPYIAGFFAEKFGKTKEELEPGVRKTVEADAVQTALSQIIEYETVNPMGSRVDMVKASSEYVMLPLWALNFKYGGKNYPLFMNGRTGKIEGELPVSRGKVLLVGLIAFIVVFLLTYLFGRVI